MVIDPGQAAEEDRLEAHLQSLSLVFPQQVPHFFVVDLQVRHTNQKPEGKQLRSSLSKEFISQAKSAEEMLGAATKGCPKQESFSYKAMGLQQLSLSRSDRGQRGWRGLLEIIECNPLA